MIEEIRDKIPDFECIPGCSDCCGLVPWSPAEVEFLPGFLEVTVKSSKELKEQAGDQKCSLLKDGRCSVYRHRPIMCRLYGTVEDLQCPNGQGPEVLLTKQEASQIMAEYRKLF